MCRRGVLRQHCCVRSRQPSPYTSPRQMPSLTGETNNHVLVAILSLVKELNLDG